MQKALKILVIDDNPEVVEEILPGYGFEITVATDGQKGLEILEKNSKAFDLVLLDVLMPNMNGWDVLRRIREDKKLKNIPVIMMTALDSEIDQVAGLKVGADDYITKPFQVPMLLARIEALMRRVSMNTTAPSFDLPFETDAEIQNLTAREKEIITLVAKGLSNKEISEKLYVSELTVKTHLKNIFKKLNVSSRTQAILVAINKGLISE
ncbi:MAG: response regulator transcription factor [Vampirovibrionia bacterium]